MVVSLIYPETCGFAKVAAWEVLETTRREIKREPEESTSAFRSRLSVAQYQRFVNAFNDRKENFAIPQKYFHAKLTALQQKFSRWNSRKIEERTHYLNTFSTTTWANLSSSQKDEHSLMECKSCAQRYSHEQSLFPVKCKQFPTTAVDSDILKDARHTASRIVTEAMAKNIKPDSTMLARALYNEIDPIFQYSVDVSLANALTTVRELRLSPKRSKAFEPLHDIGKHIENILVELPAHLTAKEASIVSDIVDVSLGDKNTKRTFDYRCPIIKVAQHSRGKVAAKAQTLLDTLVEIQDIAYSTESSRTPRQILRLHNLVWHHAILCKFYVKYFHNITSHAPVQARLVSSRSTNAEEQERVFNALKNICKATSSYQPDQILGNIFIRSQAEEKLKGNCSPQFSSTGIKQQSDVSKLAISLPSFPNTTLSLKFPHYLPPVPYQWMSVIIWKEKKMWYLLLK